MVESFTGCYSFSPDYSCFLVSLDDAPAPHFTALNCYLSSAIGCYLRSTQLHPSMF